MKSGKSKKHKRLIEEKWVAKESEHRKMGRPKDKDYGGR
jgi:hypothetical protein